MHTHRLTRLMLAATLAAVMLGSPLMPAHAQDSVCKLNAKELRQNGRLKKTDKLKKIDLLADMDIHHQSGAVFGKYLFMVGVRMTKVTLYDLKKKQVIATYKPRPHNDTSTMGTTLRTNEKGMLLGSEIYHCNQSSFGNERFDKDDPFPLLYISQRNMTGTRRGLLTVYRILPTLENGEIKAFTMEHVQSIYFPGMTDENALGTPNVAIDQVNGTMYAYSRNNNNQCVNYQWAAIAKFKLPPLRNSKGNVVTAVTLNESDILETTYMDWAMVWAQGGFVQDGRLIIFQGFPHKDPRFNHIYLRVFDLEKRRQTHMYDLVDYGFHHEPEAAFFYKGRICTATNGKGIYSFKF